MEHNSLADYPTVGHAPDLDKIIVLLARPPPPSRGSIRSRHPFFVMIGSMWFGQTHCGQRKTPQTTGCAPM